MSMQRASFQVVFPDWYDERAEYEATCKGYLPDVEVRLENGLCYKLCFYDPVSLRQDLEEQARRGHPFLAEPELVVVPEVSTEAVRSAVAGMWREGYFDRLPPTG